MKDRLFEDPISRLWSNHKCRSIWDNDSGTVKGRNLAAAYTDFIDHTHPGSYFHSITYLDRLFKGQYYTRNKVVDNILQTKTNTHT